MTETSGIRRASAPLRLAVLLMVIAIGGCDNVEWGGLDLAILPPPPKAGPVAGDLEAAERLPENAILYYVSRDSAGASLTPVGEIGEEGLTPIRLGQDAEAAGSQFIAAFMRQGAEFTLFHNGRRAGTLVIDSASIPGTSVCRRLPRATGDVELTDQAGGATEFLAMARTQAPDGRMIPGDTVRVERRMQVVGNILAERTLRARNAPLPNWSTARRQLFPFRVEGAQDLGFTATFLVDDELRVGNDDTGYSLFIVYTPQAQTGYDTAYVDYTSYTASGKAAPRVIDFLDWDRDGSAELLLEVYGTQNRWFEAVGKTGDEWQRIFQDRCDPGATTLASDTATADTVEAGSAPATDGQTGGQTGGRSGGAAPPPQPAPTTTPDTTPDAAAVVPMPVLEPVIQLVRPVILPARRDTAGG